MQIFGKILVYVFIAYLALCLIVFIFQRKMLYFPIQAQYSKADASNQGLQHWLSQEDFRGFVTREEITELNGTVIVFHGNAGTAFHRSFYVDALLRKNYRVILAEYPGYGGREGELSESSLVADALDTIQLAAQEFDGPIFLWGESLGCGVVSAAVSETDIHIDGVVLFLPWDTLAKVAQTHYWYFPTRWLLLDKYDNVENLKGYDGKIAVLIAGDDEIVPFKHGKTLYDSIETEKKLWVFEGSRHNTVPVYPDLHWWAEVMEFVSNGN